jgi:hypothetical protein
MIADWLGLNTGATLGNEDVLVEDEVCMEEDDGLVEDGVNAAEAVKVSNEAG